MTSIHTNYNRSTDVISGNSDSQNNDSKEKIQGTDKEKDTVFYGGDLNLAQDTIASRQAKAGKNALKTIMDTFSDAAKQDDTIAARSEHIEKLDGEILENQEQVRTLESSKSDLMEDYGVTEDSEEQQDLKLLERRDEAMALGKNANFTKEENERIATIDKNGQTEYQSRILDVDAQQRSFNTQIKDAVDAQREDTSVIHGIHKARLKEHNMVDAQKEAQDIIEEANSEVEGMLLDEAVDNIDGKMDDLEEKAQEKAEEADKKEEKNEESQTGATSSATTNDSNIGSADQHSILQAEVDHMVANNKITTEDIKGIECDELV